MSEEIERCMNGFGVQVEKYQINTWLPKHASEGEELILRNIY